MVQQFALGIDIGGTNTAYGIVDSKGNCIQKGNIPTNSFETPASYLKALSSSINQTLSSIKANHTIIGIGVGAPNANFYNGTIEEAPNLNWKGTIPFVDLLQEYFPIPVILTNDANAAAVGELTYGGAKNLSNFIVITLGTGVGSGFVINGQLMYGQYGFAGEFGHTVLFPEGRLCGCNRKGCIEAYASSKGIVQTYTELVEEFPIKSKEYPSIPILNPKTLHQAAEKGNELAIKAFEKTGKWLGIQLADAVAITNPETIFLFGGVAKTGPILIDPLKVHLEQNLMAIYKNSVQVKVSELNDENAAILGASALVWNHFKQNGNK